MGVEKPGRDPRAILGSGPQKTPSWSSYLFLMRSDRAHSHERLAKQIKAFGKLSSQVFPSHTLLSNEGGAHGGQRNDRLCGFWSGELRSSAALVQAAIYEFRELSFGLAAKPQSRQWETSGSGEPTQALCHSGAHMRHPRVTWNKPGLGLP